jgi:acetyltransferase-like isoleucine patch superfamily enzyme
MTIESRGQVLIGDRVIFGHHCTLCAIESITIGEDSMIGEMVSIRDHDHKFSDLAQPIREQGMKSAPVHIGRDVWIGGKATIIKGVSIGDGAVIGANAVVTKNVPDRAIAVGVPAHIVGYRGTSTECTSDPERSRASSF